MKKLFAMLGSTTAVVALATAANAQETIYAPVDAPTKAAEIGVGLGYSQPAGDLTRRDIAGDLARGRCTASSSRACASAPTIA